MALRFDAITPAEYQSPVRGSGQLYDNAVTTGSDFTLTAWQGFLINVDVSADCLGIWSESTGTSMTTTVNRDVGASGASAATTVGFKIFAGQRNEMVVPRTSVSSGPVYLRVAAVSGTVTVIVDRATAA